MRRSSSPKRTRPPAPRRRRRGVLLELRDRLARFAEGQILSPDALRATAAESRRARSWRATPSGSRASAHGNARLPQPHHLPDDAGLLLRQPDAGEAGPARRASSGSRRAARTPSRRYAHFVYNIPAKFKQKDGVVKYFFKKAIDGILPDSIIYRPKQGFRTPVIELFKGRSATGARRRSWTAASRGRASCAATRSRAARRAPRGRPRLQQPAVDGADAEPLAPALDRILAPTPGGALRIPRRRPRSPGIACRHRLRRSTPRSTRGRTARRRGAVSVRPTSAKQADGRRGSSGGFRAARSA